MPKIKTHKGVKKRFRVTATGKVKHKRCGSSHLMSHKSGKRVRRLRKQPTLRVEAEAKRLRGALLVDRLPHVEASEETAGGESAPGAAEGSQPGAPAAS